VFLKPDAISFFPSNFFSSPLSHYCLEHKKYSYFTENRTEHLFLVLQNCALLMLRLAKKVGFFSNI
jgi:hypothetical protein